LDTFSVGILVEYSNIMYKYKINERK